MKKVLLTILSLVMLIGTVSFSALACSPRWDDNQGPNQAYHQVIKKAPHHVQPVIQHRDQKPAPAYANNAPQREPRPLEPQNHGGITIHLDL